MKRMSQDTLDWLKTLPAPTDGEGWNKRLADQFASVLGGIAKPVVDAEDAEFFDVEPQS